MNQFYVGDVISLREQVQRYFIQMDEEKRYKIRAWYKRQKPQTTKQNNFFTILYQAMERVDYNYKICTLEPGLVNGEIIFQKGMKVEEPLNCFEWQRKVLNYAPQHNSDIATLQETYLWYAYRIMNGFWTLSYVCDNSSGQGNYRDSIKPSLSQEPSGFRKVGGVYDGIGNTYKIVKYRGKFGLLGGAYTNFGRNIPVSDWQPCISSDFPQYYAVPTVVLRNI